MLEVEVPRSVWPLNQETGLCTLVVFELIFCGLVFYSVVDQIPRKSFIVYSS